MKLKKPKAILFDITGTVAKTTFIDMVLLPYVQKYCRVYLEENWTRKAAQADINNLRAQVAQDAEAPKIPEASASKEDIIKACGEYVDYCFSKKIENKGILLLRFHMWFDGYQRNRLETPVYSDVAVQIQKWRSDLGIKLYVVSNGWSEATKCFLSKTNHGDMNLMIEKHFDTSIGPLTDAATFQKLVEEIGEPAGEVLFLTKSADEANLAKSVGIAICLCLTHRRNIEKLDEAGRALPRVRSFNELEFE